MSIERMKRVWLLTPADGVGRLLDVLSGAGLVHPEALSPPEAEPAGDAAGADAPSFTRPETADPAELDDRIGKLRQALEVFDAFAPVKRGFARNFVALPLEVTRADYDRALAETNAADLFAKTTDLSDRHADLSRQIADAEAELERLAPWEGAEVGAPPKTAHCRTWLGTMTARSWADLEADEAVAAVLAVDCVAEDANRVLVAAVALNEDADAAADFLRRAGLDSLDLPDDAASIDDRIADLKGIVNDRRMNRDALESVISRLADEYRAPATVCLAHWEKARETIVAAGDMLRSERIGIVGGYVRADDVEALRRTVEACDRPVEVIDHDPRPDEAVPVALRTAPAFAPARFLTRLFGVPDYFAFDPSPYILLTFLLFFGFCFGDVIYGIVIFLLARWIARKVKGYPNLRDFFTLISWGGVASILVGAVLGAWMGDLFDPTRGLVGEHSIFARVRTFFMVEALDPMTQPVRVLIVALFIGILNQFYGIVMRMYKDARRGDWMSALCDGGLWLLFLPGLTILIIGFLVGAPGPVRTVGLVLLVAGAVGLVLTQGRNEKGLFAKALTGLVSLYGILGTYGTTSFIGDTLSYSRLLALGLTTTIVGMSFNIIAGLLKGVPVAGIVLVMLILLIGHAFNILVSILGAFVHSARLVFVEYFGRFYEVGGKRFRPLGTSERVRILES